MLSMVRRWCGGGGWWWGTIPTGARRPVLVSVRGVWGRSGMEIRQTGEDGTSSVGAGGTELPRWETHSRSWERNKRSRDTTLRSRTRTGVFLLLLQLWGIGCRQQTRPHMQSDRHRYMTWGCMMMDTPWYGRRSDTIQHRRTLSDLSDSPTPPQ